MNLIKIKVNEEDRETLACMLDYAVSHARQCRDEAIMPKSQTLFDNKLKQFKDLRGRVVFEKLEEPKEESKSPLPNVKWSDLNKTETFLNNTFCSTHAVIEKVKE